jgi:hypothetical protein
MGRDSLAAVALLRAEPGVFGPWPAMRRSPARWTAGSWTPASAADRMSCALVWTAFLRFTRVGDVGGGGRGWCGIVRSALRGRLRRTGRVR